MIERQLSPVEDLILPTPSMAGRNSNGLRSGGLIGSCARIFLCRAKVPSIYNSPTQGREVNKTKEKSSMMIGRDFVGMLRDSLDLQSQGGRCGLFLPLERGQRLDSNNLILGRPTLLATPAPPIKPLAKVLSICMWLNHEHHVQTINRLQRFSPYGTIRSSF